MRRGFIGGVIVVTLALTLLAGCGKKEAAKGPTTAGTKTPITFTFYNDELTEDRPFTDPIARKITEATGVTLIVDHPVGGSQDATSLMLASGDYPDFIYTRANIGRFKDSGALIPLEDLIDKYGPNIKKLYGPYYSHNRWSLEDPHIYQFGSYPVRQAYWASDGTMQIQHAVLKELGYPKMETLDDVERVLKAYIAKYPTINGQPTIGMSMVLQNYGWLFAVGNASGFMAGWPDDGEWYVDQTTLQTTYKWLLPEMKDYARWLNKIYNEGLLDPEAFTQTTDEFNAKVSAGRVLALSLPSWYYASARTALLQDNMPERTYAPLNITTKPGIKSRFIVDYGYAGGWGIGVTTSCKDPERLVEFFNWLCSEEAQILINWGIEGENYDIVNGKRVLQEDDWKGMESDPDYFKKTGVAPAGFGGSGGWTYPFPDYGPAYIDSTGNYITPRSPEIIKSNYLPIERETLAAYGREMWTDFFPPVSETPIQRHGRAFEYTLPEEYSPLFTEGYEIINNRIGEILMSPTSSFDSAWQTLVNDLKEMGAEKMSKAMTELIQNKVALWEKYSE